MKERGEIRAESAVSLEFRVLSLHLDWSMTVDRSGRHQSATAVEESNLVMK